MQAARYARPVRGAPQAPRKARERFDARAYDRPTII